MALSMMVQRKTGSSIGGEGPLDGYDEGGNTPLCLAAGLGNDKAIELLLQWGANPNKKNQKGEAPVHLASSSISNRHVRV